MNKCKFYIHQLPCWPPVDHLLLRSSSIRSTSSAVLTTEQVLMCFLPVAFCASPFSVASCSYKWPCKRTVDAKIPFYSSATGLERDTVLANVQPVPAHCC